MNDWQSAPEVMDAQNLNPVWIVNQTCDGLLPHENGVLHDVMSVLGLDYHQEECDERPFPLTEAEQDFIGEDAIPAPYGGAFTGPAWLYKGEKYIGLEVEVCYDGSGRLFSFESYDGTLYADYQTAWNEAQRLADFLTPLMLPFGGRAIAVEGLPDRHFVAIMYPVEHLFKTFDKAPRDQVFELFKGCAAQLFKGYEPVAKPLESH